MAHVTDIPPKLRRPRMLQDLLNVEQQLLTKKILKFRRFRDPTVRTAIWYEGMVHIDGRIMTLDTFTHLYLPEYKEEVEQST